MLDVLVIVVAFVVAKTNVRVDGRETNVIKQFMTGVTPLPGSAPHSSDAYTCLAVPSPTGCGGACASDVFCQAYSVQTDSVPGAALDCCLFAAKQRYWSKLPSNPGYMYYIKDDKSVIGGVTDKTLATVWSDPMIFINITFPVVAKVTGWVFYAKTDRDFVATVWRTTGATDTYKLIGKNNITVTGVGKQVQYISEEEQITVQAGDMVGMQAHAVIAEAAVTVHFAISVPTSASGSDTTPKCCGLLVNDFSWMVRYDGGHPDSELPVGGTLVKAKESAVVYMPTLAALTCPL